MESKKENQEQNQRYQRIKCPYCNSGFNYYKIKDKIWQCRGCGEEFNFDKRKIGHKQLTNNKNPSWKGDDVGYTNLHQWVRRRKSKPDFCESCGINKPHDLANISGEYKRDVNDFKWLCRSCHMKEDGRINNLKQFKEDKE